MITIQVYLDDGRVISYAVKNSNKAREHSAAIAKNGFRWMQETTLEVYPVSRILKVKYEDPNVTSNYGGTVRGT